jgi:AbrB family looped-hinge helix DNA binding protein
MTDKTTKKLKAEARLTTGFRVTIPKRFRDSMGLKPGDSVAFDVKEGYAVISAVPKEENDQRSAKL